MGKTDGLVITVVKTADEEADVLVHRRLRRHREGCFGEG